MEREGETLAHILVRGCTSQAWGHHGGRYSHRVSLPPARIYLFAGTWKPDPSK